MFGTRPRVGTAVLARVRQGPLGGLQLEVHLLTCWAPGSHAFTVTRPGGAPRRSNAPSAPVTAQLGFSSTTTYEIMCGWMLQNTGTSPGLSNTTLRGGSLDLYWPRSNDFTGETEKTLW